MGVSYCQRFRRQFVSLSKKNAYNISNAKVATICIALIPSMFEAVLCNNLVVVNILVKVMQRNSEVVDFKDYGDISKLHKCKSLT